MRRLLRDTSDANLTEYAPHCPRYPHSTQLTARPAARISPPSLDNFVIGDNDEAAGAPALARRTGASTPFYLWGEPGSGKTHLLRRGRQLALRRRPVLRSQAAVAPA